LRGTFESGRRARVRPTHLSGVERIALAAPQAASVAVIPGAFDRFVFGKLAIATVGVLCCAFAPSRGRLPRTASLLLAAATLLLLIAALTGRDPHVQLLGLPPRYEGIVALPVYLGALLTGARLLGPERVNGSTAWFSKWLSLAALAVAAVAILEAVGLEPLPGTGARAGSLLGNASDQGAFSLLCLGPLLALAVLGRRSLHVAGALAAAIALVDSASRGALVGFLALAIVLLASASRRRLAAATALATAAVVAAAFAVPAVRHRILEASPLSGRTATGRLLLLRETVRLVADRPAIGFGPSSFVDDIPLEHTREYERVVGPENPPDSPHDWVLQAVLAGGVGLGAIAIALALITVARGWRARSRQPTTGEGAAYAGLLAGLLGYAVALLFHFTSPGTTPLAAVFAGALLATGRTGESAMGDGLDRLRRAATIATSVGLLALLTAAAVAEIPLRTAILEAARGQLQSADRHFHQAAAWRPWDFEVPALAAHAFAVLASADVAQAADLGARWSARALADDPRSVSVLEDAGTLALARGRREEALLLLRRALRLEPNNLTLLTFRGRVTVTPFR